MSTPSRPRDGEPEHRAGAGGRGVGGVLERGEQEDNGFEAFAEDGEERHHHEARRRAAREAAAGAPLEGGPQRSRAWRRIQTTMS